MLNARVCFGGSADATQLCWYMLFHMIGKLCPLVVNKGNGFIYGWSAAMRQASPVPPCVVI